MVVALEWPGAQIVRRSARVFASLPAAGGLVLLLAAALALICANTPLAPYYRLFIDTPLGIGSPNRMLTLTVANGAPKGCSGFSFCF